MINKVLRSNLVTLANAYAKATRSSLPAVSKKFYGNVVFFDDFKRGKASISIDKYAAVLESFSADWPPGADWPYLNAIVIVPPRRRRG